MEPDDQKGARGNKEHKTRVELHNRLGSSKTDGNDPKIPFFLIPNYLDLVEYILLLV